MTQREEVRMLETIFLDNEEDKTVEEMEEEAEHEASGLEDSNIVGE